MALTSGTKLGPYEILASVGAGEMGEVYRAHDTRLDRTVALKVLPQAFFTDPDRLQRSKDEARTLRRLNHPNVMMIPSGVGETRTIQTPQCAHYLGAALLSDSKQALISTVVAQSAPQSAVRDLATGAVLALGQTGQAMPAFAGIMQPGPSVDGKYCVLAENMNGHWLQPLDGTAGREISGIDSGETVVGWHEDSNHLFLLRPNGSDAEIYNLNLATGQRKLWTSFTPGIAPLWWDKAACGSHQTAPAMPI